jgi:pSer/pThr/pTyr-binding forkhead associated (FHA) protein
MNLHLRVLHGTLKRQDGANIGPDIAVHGQRFIIGSGPECNMRCPSSTISENHCEIISEENGIFVRDLRSESGTFLNDERVTTKRQISNGDHLRIGKLEFEVVITAPQKQASRSAVSPRAQVEQPRKQDSIGDDISELLSAADEEDRARQKHDPSARQFVPPAAPKPVAAEEAKEKKKLVRPPQKPPGKLPPKPKVVADNTVNAAEEVLKKFFDKPQKK